MPDVADRLLERLFPPPHDVFTPLGYEPSPRQAEFHAIAPFADGGPWDVLFGGAMGGGKTLALVMDAVDRCVRWPGLEAWIVRQTYADLERDVIPIVEKLRYCEALGARWHGGQRTLTFPGGGKVRFLHARNTLDAANIRGQCQYLVPDERTHIDPDVLDTLALRIRSGHSSVPVIGIRSGTNPGGIGHGRVKANFIEPAPLGRVEIPILSEEGHQVREVPGDPQSRLLTRWFLPSKADDNPHLDGSYYARFEMMPADTKAAFRDGDWTKFAGMRFGDWAPGVNIVTPSQMPLDLADLDCGIGVDHGSTSPFAAVWGALINGGETLVVYRELHQAGLTPLQQAELVLSVQQDAEVGQPVWIDPSTFSRSAEEPLATSTPDRPAAGSIASWWAQAGVPIRKATNARLPGWAMIDQLLQNQALDGEDPRPGLLVYDTCPNLIRSLSNAPRDEKNPEDVPKAYHDDHALDAFRYLCMGMLGGPQRGESIENAGERLAALRVSTGVR